MPISLEVRAHGGLPWNRIQIQVEGEDYISIRIIKNNRFKVSNDTEFPLILIFSIALKFLISLQI